MGNSDIAPCILNLCPGRMWIIIFTLRSLYPGGKNHRYPLDRRLGGSHNESAGFGKEKMSGS
jgi:hypothetical protein